MRESENVDLFFAYLSVRSSMMILLRGVTRGRRQLVATDDWW